MCGWWFCHKGKLSEVRSTVGRRLVETPKSISVQFGGVRRFWSVIVPQIARNRSQSVRGGKGWFLAWKRYQEHLLTPSERKVRANLLKIPPNPYQILNKITMAKLTKIIKFSKIANCYKLDFWDPGGVGGCLYHFPSLLAICQCTYWQILSGVPQLWEIATWSRGNFRNSSSGDQFTLHP